MKHPAILTKAHVFIISLDKNSLFYKLRAIVSDKKPFLI